MQTPLSHASSAGKVVPSQLVPQKHLFLIAAPSPRSPQPQALSSLAALDAAHVAKSVHPWVGGHQADWVWLGRGGPGVPLRRDFFLQRACLLLGGFRRDLPCSLPLGLAVTKTHCLNVFSAQAFCLG